MSRKHREPEMPPIAAIAGTATLAGALGAFIAGLRGLQAGCVTGIVLAVLPYLVHRSAFWLTRPDGLPRFVVRGTGHVVFSAVAPVLRTILRPFSAFARLLHGPAVLMMVLGSMVVDFMALALAKLGRTLATPLGFANLGALLVIAIDIAGLSFSALAIGAGLVILVLTLLVTINEEGAVVPSR